MTITMKMNVLLLTAGLAGVAVMAQAKDGEAKAGMAFQGVLTEPPLCSVNEGDRVDVYFGPIGVNKIDGVNYRQILNYQVSCEDGGRGNGLTLSLSGSAAIFDSEALMTDRTNLGIRVYQNDKPFTPGSTLKIALANPPRLEAVPVRKAGAVLTKGDFEAWATLRAEYQ